jgi:acyl-CoA reductase-like NAD-dependent aldehyde dehydrogenase
MNNQSTSLAETTIVLDTICTSIQLLLMLTESKQEFLDSVNQILEAERNRLPEDKRKTFDELLNKRQEEIASLIKKAATEQP